MTELKVPFIYRVPAVHGRWMETAVFISVIAFQQKASASLCYNPGAGRVVTHRKGIWISESALSYVHNKFCITEGITYIIFTHFPEMLYRRALL